MREVAGRRALARAGWRGQGCARRACTRVESSGFESNFSHRHVVVPAVDHRADAPQALALRERLRGRAPPKAPGVLEISHDRRLLLEQLPRPPFRRLREDVFSRHLEQGSAVAAPVVVEGGGGGSAAGEGPSPCTMEMSPLEDPQPSWAFFPLCRVGGRCGGARRGVRFFTWSFCSVSARSSYTEKNA